MNIMDHIASIEDLFNAEMHVERFLYSIDSGFFLVSCQRWDFDPQS